MIDLFSIRILDEELEAVKGMTETNWLGYVE